jgi:hypothetical protein
MPLVVFAKENKMTKINRLLKQYDLPVSDGYGLICAAEDYARLMGISVDNVIEAALTSRQYANHLISVVRKRNRKQEK